MASKIYLIKIFAKTVEDFWGWMSEGVRIASHYMS